MAGGLTAASHPRKRPDPRAEQRHVVSIVSLWEIAIKRRLGKLHFSEDFKEVMTEEEFDLLAVSYDHLHILGDLPLHHRDPFDRLLISQSLAERIPIITGDQAFAAYSVEIVW